MGRPGQAPGAGDLPSLARWPGLAAALQTARQAMEAAALQDGDPLRLGLGAAARTLRAPYAAFRQLDPESGKPYLAEWFQAPAEASAHGGLAVLMQGQAAAWTGLMDGTAALQRATVTHHPALPALPLGNRLGGCLQRTQEIWVPVRLADRTWGRLSVLRGELDPLETGEALFLEALARELGWVLADRQLASVQRRAAALAAREEEATAQALGLVRQQKEAAEAQAREQAHVIAVLQEAIDSLDRSGDLEEFVPTVIGLIARALDPGAVALLQVRGPRCRLQAAYLQGQVLRRADLLSPQAPPSPVLRELTEGFELPPAGLQACATQGSGEAQVVDHADGGASCPFDHFFVSEGGPLALNLWLMASGHALGALGIYRRSGQRYTASEIALAEAIAAQLSLALRAAQLAEEARRVATLEERTRLAREMHDTLAQGFTGVLMQLEVADAAVSAQRVERARTAIATAMDLARDSLGEARRAVRALRNPTLERRGLAEALAELCAQMRSSTFQAVELQVTGAPLRLDAHVEEQVLRVAQESLVNAVKHARARRTVVSLELHAQALRLQVRDDGAGIPQVLSNPAGFGLVGMRERAVSIGATLDVASAPGQGTTVSLRLGLRG